MLMPDCVLLKQYEEGDLNWEEYQAIYQKQLDCLDAEKVYEWILSETFIRDVSCEPILLGCELLMCCYESTKTLDVLPCHRRLVAAWFSRELRIDVPEFLT
jgi:hypothetical protein